MSITGLGVTMAAAGLMAVLVSLILMVSMGSYSVMNGAVTELGMHGFAFVLVGGLLALAGLVGRGFRKLSNQ